MGRAIGIDLGTTYSAVAVLRDSGEVEVLPNRDGEDITPSVVLFQSFGGVDEPLVGIMAKHSAASAPDDVVQFVKRQLGDPDWRFISTGGSSYSAEEVSATILRRLKEDAELVLGEQITDAVITVPAYFDDARRTATKHAGAIAGLNVLRVLNEPTAAALSFGVDTSAQGLVLVYDLGGGTFDVTLMRITDDGFDVLGTDGDRMLGGFDFDNRLIEYIAEKIKEQGGPSDLLDDSAQVASLREKAEMAKRSLTTVATTTVHVSAEGSQYRVPIGRSASIDHLLLVGGSTRMPMVRELVERLAGKPADRSVRPDDAVAMGAAIQAAMEESATAGADLAIFDGKAPLIADVTSQGLGVIVLDRNTRRDVNEVVIPRNSKIPAKFDTNVSTVQDNQKSVLVQVTQGDDTNPDYVVEIGSKDIPLPPYPEDAPLRVTYAYDIDQTVFIEVTDLTTNQSLGTFEVDRLANLTDDQLKTATAKISSLSVQ